MFYKCSQKLSSSIEYVHDITALNCAVHAVNQTINLVHVCPTNDNPVLYASLNIQDVAKLHSYMKVDQNKQMKYIYSVVAFTQNIGV